MSVVKSSLKKILKLFGFDPTGFNQGLAGASIKWAVKQQGLLDLVEKLRKIAPDISNQESSEKSSFNDYCEKKRRALQAFQCSMMLKIIGICGKNKVMVVDIGDSAGTHMLYLKELTKNKYEVDTIGVNLDPRAIEKIKARGMKALLCRAEDLDLGEKEIDFFTSFQMIEHLHNPSIFFRRLANKSKGNRMLVTLPYLKRSRVGFYKIKNQDGKKYYAEEEHIFELSPEDWRLLMLHSGWRVVYEKVYYQYPKKIPIISWILSRFWRSMDFEGFWAAIIEKDTKLSDLYMDWEE
jgi:2-polyprenyl-3-methyl-5-hydroxy-6-metoxy-1,4-benzoquinol methylase